MKKNIILNALFVIIFILSGCGSLDQIDLQPKSNSVKQTSQNSDSTFENELLKYGEKTESRNGHKDSIIPSKPEIGSGKLLNDDKDKSINSWYFVLEKNEGKEQKYSVIIDDKCLIHSIGFMNGSCLKYFTIDENKNIIYDGLNGSSVLIFGEILPNNSIQVVDIILQQ